MGVEWGCMGNRYVIRYIKQFLARLAVGVSMTALIAMPLFGDIFQLNPNRKGMRTLPCIGEVCNDARKVSTFFETCI